ncbi:MAG: NAD+ synthase [Gammaproteobacteria bacterium]
MAMAQLNLTVGDFNGNANKIIAAAKQAKTKYQADLVVYPELTVCGYPPEDLVYRHDVIIANNQALAYIQSAVTDIDLLIGHLEQTSSGLYNAVSYIHNGQKITTYYKQELPNYGVFDEKRYYQPGQQAQIINIKGHRIALGICEDLWHTTVAKQAKTAGADVIISPNASPFDEKKIVQRQEIIRQRVAENKLPIIYVANVGGQDDLIFDGGSFAMDSQGNIQVQAPYFTEAVVPVQINAAHQPEPGEIAPTPSHYEAIYRALVIGLRDYVNKNGFNSVVLGVSGGIDSALVLCLAVDALGADRVYAGLLPSQFTSNMSVEDALALCHNLNVKHCIISIEPAFDAFKQSLAQEFSGLQNDTTEENLQARCRANLLMAISNKKGAMLLSTGNKSEVAVGYCTLYGDMAGGYALIKDIFKMDVYALSHYRNTISPVIPQRIIDRPPTAELAPNQTDQDTLPPYPVLDAILKAYLEDDKSVDDLIQHGYDKIVVERVIHMVKRNEYKRRQAAPGPKISKRAFARERRYPITCGN